MPRLPAAFAVALPLCAAGCVDQAAGGAAAREQIRAVGSSTVYPFTTLVAERFVAAHPDARPPVIESTGTGAGMRLFCAGIGAAHPDIADASRRMKRGEYDTCARNGAGDVIEVQVGIDGIAFAEALNGPAMRLSTADIYRALAAAPLQAHAPPDEVVEDAERERDPGAARDEQDALVFADVDTAPAVGPVDHDLHWYAGRK